MKNDELYIKYDNQTIYFNYYDYNYNIINKNNNVFEINILDSNKEKNDDEIEMSFNIDKIINKIDKKINEIEGNKIILNFNITYNSNLYINNNYNKVYINNTFNNYYKEYKIKNINEIEEDNNLLYILDLSKDNKYKKEYLLFKNNYCIQVTLKNSIYIELEKYLIRLLLSASFNSNSVAIDSNLNIIFENNINYKEIRDKYKCELDRIDNLVDNYSKNKNIFNTEYLFNVLFIGNNREEKKFIYNYIVNKIKNSHIFGDNLIDKKVKISKEISINEIDNLFKRAGVDYDILYINSFNNLFKNKLASYFINYLVKNLKEHKIKFIVVSSSDKSILKLIKNNRDLDKMISYKFVFSDYNIDKIYDLLMDKFRNNNYKLNFKKEEIIDTLDILYSKSKVKNEDFVIEIYTLVIKYLLENNKDEIDTSIFNSMIKNVKTIKDELNELVGLSDIKKNVYNLESYLDYRKNVLKCDDNLFLNSIFTGSAGTGKTTIARIMAKILFNLGYIDNDNIVEVTPNNLIGEYLGHTKGVFDSVIEKVDGGVLFIDEAYLFNNRNEYFNEVLVELLKYMEDPKHVVFFAGYKEDIDIFINKNDGLKSRIMYSFEFENYTINELLDIFKLYLSKKGLDFDNEVLEKIELLLNTVINDKDYGNARFIEKLINLLIIKHSVNLREGKTSDLKRINVIDIDKEEIFKFCNIKESLFGF